MAGWNKYNNAVEAAKWLKRKVELIYDKDTLLRNQQQKQTKYIVRIFRGGIFDCELGNANIGGEKNKTRPVLIISQNILNQGHTVIVAPLSTKFKLNSNGLPQYKNHYLLKKSDYSFLDKDSVVKLEDIRSVDVVRIRKLRGNIEKSDLKRIKDNILFTLGY